MNKIVESYKKLGGLLEGHFLLSSGLHSDTYLQSEKVMMHPDEAAEIIAPLAQALKDTDFKYVVSPAIGAIRFGYELARQTGKLSMFTERVDGEMTFRRGFSLEKGDKVVIAEDVVTTGKSTNECIQAVIKAGGIPVAVACMIDRSGGAADFNIPFIPLVSINVDTWKPEECPMCKKGSKAIKPGSRAEI